MKTHADHLPIKVIIPSEQDLRPPRAGGGKAKDFATQYYDKSRTTLLSGLSNIEKYFQATLSTSNLPVVARVKLRDEALAKSHRPDSLFSYKTCPIIGCQNFGELLISMQASTLKAFSKTILKNHSDKIRNDIAKIESIEPYSEQTALGSWQLDELQRHLEETKTSCLKLRIFDHRNPELTAELIKFLNKIAAKTGIEPPKALNYSSQLQLFRLNTPAHAEIIHEFSSFVGTQSLNTFPHFSINQQSLPLTQITEDDFPPPDPEKDYPTVGVIDSGTDPNNDLLQAWVEVRDETLIPAVDQNNNHGSLVAGMIIHGKKLNNNHEGFPNGQAKIVDVVALPQSGSASEDDLIEAIRHALNNYRHVKIWNLSINGEHCKDEIFSDFAIALDSLQDEFGVLITNSAGNYAQLPLHPWKRPDLGNDDRIGTPADSLRAITVGSIAHLSNDNACAKPGEPSPFTMKGPGAAFVPKPDISHFGGNTTAQGRYNQIGVISIDGSGNLAETVGTSFAAPLAATTAAQLMHALEEPPSRHMLKALLIHSSMLNSAHITTDDLPYTGFGTPPPAEEILTCKPWEATLIFDLNLPYHQRNFHKTDFPVPQCLLNNGKIFGEIILTLVYDPPLDPNDGAAYSQVNINTSLGMCWIDGDTEDYERKVLPFPENIGALYEKNQITHGFKWSPVKVYRKHFKRGITPRDTWRITMEMIARKPELIPESQPVALIATIRDPEKKAPVYNEAIQMMNRSGWITQNLQVKEQTRIRATN